MRGLERGGILRILFYSNYYVSYSYGIQIEYEFIHILRRLGYEAYNLVFDQILLSMEIPEKYREQIVINLDQSFKLRDDDICIYTDVISGNPLNAKKVVRYLLNKPYNLTGMGIEYGPTDYIMAYSGLVSDKLQKCFILKDEVELFRKLRVKKRDPSKIVLYFGKVDASNIIVNYQTIKSLIQKFNTVAVITRESPTTRIETLSELSNASLLVSFDPLTNLNYEATLLGVPVYIFKDHYGIITNNYFKYFGITDNLSSICIANKEVIQAWPQYEKWIENQEQMIHGIIKIILQHFRNISRHDTRYISIVKAMNESQKTLDYEQFSANDSIEFSNILKPDNIPEPIKSELFGTKRKIINIYSWKECIKTILRKFHLLNFARTIKRKVIIYKSNSLMRKK